MAFLIGGYASSTESLATIIWFPKPLGMSYHVKMYDYKLYQAFPCALGARKWRWLQARELSVLGERHYICT